MIRYKVVTQDDYSILITKPMLRLRYRKGTVVTAREGTQGILVFKDLLRAKDFCDNFSSRYGKVKKVRPIGRARRLGLRLGYNLVNEDIRTFKDFLQVLRDYGRREWPRDTMAYKSVEVLD